MLCDVIFLMAVIRKMNIRLYPIDGLKGQKQIAYGNAVGLGNIRYRPERAKAKQGLCFCPFRAISYVPKTYGVAVGYLLLPFQAVYRIQADIHFSNDGH